MVVIFSLQSSLVPSCLELLEPTSKLSLALIQGSTECNVI